MNKYRLLDGNPYPPIPDMSNYTRNFTLDQALNWRDNLGTKKVWIQSLIPPPGYPSGQTRQQIEIALNVGFKVGVYFYHWYEDRDGALDERVGLIRDYEGAIDDLANDVEDVDTGTNWSVQQRVDSINRANDTLAQYRTVLGRIRGYSGLWYVTSRLGYRTDYFDEWWLSQYDNIRDASVINLIDGITADQVVYKQFVGTSTFGMKNVRLFNNQQREYNNAERDAISRYLSAKKVTLDHLLAVRQARRGKLTFGSVGGLDLSVANDAEWNRIVATDDPQDPCQDITNDRNGLVSSLGYIGGDVLSQSGILKSKTKAAKTLVDAIRTQCDAHSINHV